jgi:hypothetical protein
MISSMVDSSGSAGMTPEAWFQFDHRGCGQLEMTARNSAP